MGLLLQPPAEVLPTPDGVIVRAALGDHDVFGCLSHYDHRVI